jgi:carboxymethylenebutenolidase
MKRYLILGLGSVLAGCAQEDAPAVDAGVASDVAATAAEHANDTPSATSITEIEPAVPVVAQEVAYGAAEEHNLNGYMVLPADAVDVPAIIMIHEWWGLNDNIRAMARRLAGEGYAVLAIDLYAGQTAETPGDAEALMSAVMQDREAVLDNLRQAHAYLDEWVLAPSIAAIGWCLGGGWSLEAGIEFGDSIDAVVMFYGRVISDERLLEQLSAPLFGIFAANDQSIPAEDVRDFRSRLRDLGKAAQVVIYPDVDHAFANPSGQAYDHASAVAAWDETLEFLDEELR